MDIAAALSIAGQALGIVKDLREIDRGVDAADYKVKIATLMESVADVKMALLEAQDELREKDAEIARLLANFENKPNLRELYGFKFETFPDGHPKGDPFCPRCEQNMGRYYRLAHRSPPRGSFECPECKTKYDRVPAFSWSQKET